MTFTIPDDLLKQANLTEREILIEVACRLFDAGKITLPQAGKLARLERVDMEAELQKRQIPLYRPTVEEFNCDLQTLEKLRGPANGASRQ